MCGAKGKHISVEVFWFSRTATVLHQCPNRDFHPYGFEWTEDARDPMAAVQSALGLVEVR